MHENERIGTKKKIHKVFNLFKVHIITKSQIIEFVHVKYLLRKKNNSKIK